MSEVKYKLAAGTNVGLIRKNNEDNFVVCPDLTTSDWRIPQVSEYADLGTFGALLVVADGMGGANAGEVASAIAVETVQQAFTPEQLKDVVGNDKSIQEFMKEVVKAADVRIFNRSKSDSSTQGMGTTIVMAWILGKRVYVCWCGDSRCYMLNKRKGLVRLSKDHSYVQELIDRGELDPEYAMDHPLSNVITRCLGDMENRAVPDTRIFQLHDGDTILLCSDGLSGLCNDMQILDLLIKFRDDPEECKNELISAALNEGGHDNVTVAVCSLQVEGDEEAVDDEEGQSTKTGIEMPESAEDESLSETLPTGAASKKKSAASNWLWMVLLVVAVCVITFFSVRGCRTEDEQKYPVTDSLTVVPAVDSMAQRPVVDDLDDGFDQTDTLSVPEQSPEPVAEPVDSLQ